MKKRRLKTVSQPVVSRLIISLILFFSSSAPAFALGRNCMRSLFSKLRPNPSEPAPPRYALMDGSLLPLGLGFSNHQQLVIGEEDMYFISNGNVVKKSLLKDSAWVLDGISNARAILPRKGALLALTESRKVYQLEEGAEGGPHEWRLVSEGIIKMYYNKAEELILRGKSKEEASRLVLKIRPNPSEPAPPRYALMDGSLLPRGLGFSNHQQLVIGEEDMYFISNGNVVKKSLLKDSARVLDGISNARAILPRKGALLALTESRKVYQLEEGAEGGPHEWRLVNEGIIKMYFNLANELMLLGGTSKEGAIRLVGASS